MKGRGYKIMETTQRVCASCGARLESETQPCQNCGSTRSRVPTEYLEMIARGAQVEILEDMMHVMLREKAQEITYSIHPVLDEECHETGYYRCVVGYSPTAALVEELRKFVVANGSWLAVNKKVYKDQYRDISMTCPTCNGSGKTVVVKTTRCEKCKGRGCVNKDVDIICRACNGTGEVDETSWMGLKSKKVQCDECDGLGVTGTKQVKVDCLDCLGKGEITVKNIDTCKVCKGKDKYYPNR
jgi:DnaJ-class molecular chaperone